MTLLNPEPDLTDNPEYSGVLYYWIWQFKLNRVSLFDITGLVNFGRTLYHPLYQGTVSDDVYLWSITACNINLTHVLVKSGTNIKITKERVHFIDMYIWLHIWHNI